MKKAGRAIYITLAAEIDWNLCGFCRYARWYGSPCEDGGMECENPIEALSEISDWMDSPNQDCWGFKPMVNVRDCADIVGLVLANGWDWKKTMWWKEDGQIKVAGLEKVSVGP